MIRVSEISFQAAVLVVCSYFAFLVVDHVRQARFCEKKAAMVNLEHKSIGGTCYVKVNEKVWLPVDTYLQMRARKYL